MVLSFKDLYSKQMFQFFPLSLFWVCYCCMYPCLMLRSTTENLFYAPDEKRNGSKKERKKKKENTIKNFMRRKQNNDKERAQECGRKKKQ